jgi:hypothetical protein
MTGFIQVGAVDRAKLQVNAAFIDANEIVSFAAFPWGNNNENTGTMILIVKDGKEYTTLVEDHVFLVADRVAAAREAAQRVKAGACVAAFLDAVPDIDAVFKALKS